MPSPGAQVYKVGLVGATGATGAAGATMPEPVSNTNGRLNATWNPVLPLTGGTLSGGLHISDTIASSPTTCSSHVTLWESPVYGFSITSSTLNCVADLKHDFYTGYSGNPYVLGIRYRELWFSTDGWRMTWDTSTGMLIYQAYNNSYLSAWYYDSSNGWRWVTWGIGYMNSGSNNMLHVNAAGVYYYNIVGNRFNFNWDGTVYGRVDNAVQFAFQRMCDERVKQDIAPSSLDCLATIRKIRTYQYRWRNYVTPRRPKPAPANAPTIPIGFIAQRLYEDFPDAVVRGPAGRVKGAVPMWGGDYNTIIATLVGALQQLDQEVKSLSGGV